MTDRPRIEDEERQGVARWHQAEHGFDLCLIETMPMGDINGDSVAAGGGGAARSAATCSRISARRAAKKCDWRSA